MRADFTAKVQRVVDGDTIHVKDEAGKKFKVRLTGIDAPEQNQPYGLASTYHLRGLLLNKFVLLESKPKKGKPYSVDRYKRVLAKIVLDFFHPKDLIHFPLHKTPLYCKPLYLTDFVDFDIF